MIAGTIIGTIGNVNYPEYDGGPVVRGADGSYDLEYVFAPEDDHDEPGARWTVYRADLSEPGDWCNWEDVARLCGHDVELYTTPFEASFGEDPISRDENAMARAIAISDAASYYGWENLDSYPLVLTKDEIEERYSEEAIGS